VSSLRAAEEADRAAIFALHASAFPSDAEARLVESLWSNGRIAVSLVATEDGTVVGHVLFTPVKVAGTGAHARGVGLAPLAVLSDRRRKGIGGELVRAGLVLCRRAGFGFAVVLGDPAYYQRFGFRCARDTGLDNEYGAGAEFMVIELASGALSDVSGCVRYGTEFSAL